jgi:GT2 family glycosyltransferase/predicted O-methyltransferase YrrM
VTRPAVTIVIPVWNAVETTMSCLTMLRDTLGPDDQVVVVDNGSRDDTPAFLTAQPWVEVVTHERNEGFAAGCNAGARRAANPVVVFLNNDTLPTPGWIEGLVAPFADPRVAATGPMSNFVSGPQLLVDDAYRPTGPADIVRYADAQRRRAVGRVHETSRLVGFCLAVRTEVFAEVGGFDESFGLGGCEDDDLCNRLRSAGWRLLIVEDTFVHHIGHQTFDDNDVDWYALQQDNLVRLEHKSATGRPLSFLVLCGGEPRPLIATLVGIEQTMGAMSYEVLLLVPDPVPFAEVLAGVGGVRVVDVAGLPEDRAWQLGQHSATGRRRALIRAGEAVDVSAVQRLLDTDARMARPMPVGAALEAGDADDVGVSVRTRHEFLDQLHELVKPKQYLEIGVQYGISLRLARPGTVAIGIDPDPRTAAPPNGWIFPVTSDAFFADVPVNVLAHPIDFAFIDGMHLVEYALRDFINCEERSHPYGVIALDDVLPYSPDIAHREPLPGDWAGDVWKLWPILAEYRPELKITMVDVEPTGLMIVQGLDPVDGPRRLLAHYDEICATWAREVDDGNFTTGVLRPAVALEQIKRSLSLVASSPK